MSLPCFESDGFYYDVDEYNEIRDRVAGNWTYRSIHFIGHRASTDIYRANQIYWYWQLLFAQRQSLELSATELDPYTRLEIARQIAPDGNFDLYFPPLPREIRWNLDDIWRFQENVLSGC